MQYCFIAATHLKEADTQTHTEYRQQYFFTRKEREKANTVQTILNPEIQVQYNRAEVQRK